MPSLFSRENMPFVVLVGMGIVGLGIAVALQPSAGEVYLLLKSTHYWLSRILLTVAAVMFGVSFYIGILRKGDATPLFRRVTLLIWVMVVGMALLGVTMYAWGGRPLDEVHLIYGIGAVLALPFFMYVEATSPRRPAMGSYMWGYAMLAAILVRSILTGAL